MQDRTLYDTILLTKSADDLVTLKTKMAANVVVLVFLMSLVAMSEQKEYYCVKQNITGMGLDMYGLRFNAYNTTGHSWFSKFESNTIINDTSPANVTMTFMVDAFSNEAIKITSGNNPKDGSCHRRSTRVYQWYRNVACVMESNPGGCGDHQRILHIFGKNKNLLFDYHCVDRSCKQYKARCLSNKDKITAEEKTECQNIFKKFNLGDLPPEDKKSSKNACYAPQKPKTSSKPTSASKKA